MRHLSFSFTDTGSRKTLKTFLLAFISTMALAHDPAQLGEIKGEHLSLFYSDHAIAGHVEGHLLYATPTAGQDLLRVSYREEGKDYEANLKAGSDKTISGKIRNNEIIFTRISAKESVLEGTKNGSPFKIVLSSKEMQGGHYVDPIFDVTEASKSYQFRLENGMACMGCAVKIAFVVLGML